MSRAKSAWKWFRAHWLDIAIPAAIFLLAAAIYREIRWGKEGRQYAEWERHFSAAAAAQNKGNGEMALKELFAAAAAAPDKGNAHAQLAHAFKGVRLPDKAAEQMELALRHEKPGYSECIDVVKIYCDIGKFSDADRVLSKYVLPSWPNTADTLFLQGIIALYGSQGTDAAARAAGFLEASLRLKPENVGTRFRYGICLARLGKLTEAEAELRKVIQTSATQAGAYKELADVLQKQGKPEDAKQTLAKLQHLDDANQTIQYIESRRHLGKVPPEDLMELGSLYLETGQLSNAEAALAEYSLENPTDAHAHRKLAEVHEKMNLKQNAISDMKLARALEAGGGSKR